MSDDLRNDSGIEIKPLYSAADLDGWDPAAKLGAPGEQPYTRGVYPTMYRGKLWTMRQYAGFGSAADTNQHKWVTTLITPVPKAKWAKSE